MTSDFDFRQALGVFLNHMGMLSNEDLHAIGAVVDEKIDKKFDEKLEPVLEAIREGFEQTATKTDLAAMRHALMDHTDRTVNKAVGNLRSELRERDLIG